MAGPSVIHGNQAFGRIEFQERNFEKFYLDVTSGHHLHLTDSYSTIKKLQIKNSNNHRDLFELVCFIDYFFSDASCKPDNSCSSVSKRDLPSVSSTKPKRTAKSISRDRPNI